MPVPSPTCLVFLIRDLGHGGAQRQLVTLARALAGQGTFDITVVHFYPGPFERELHAAGVKTACVGKRHRWDLAGFFIRLLSVMRRLKPDVIHGYLHESNLMALLIKPLCGWPKVVWGIRDSKTDADTWGILGRLSFRLNCLFSGWADRIIANSRAGRGYYTRQGYPSARFEVVPNGIDISRFQPRPEAHQGFTVAMIGRLHPMKDHPTMLRALARVPDAKVVVMGDGDATYLADLRALAEDLGVSDRVEWQPAREDLARMYPDFDAVISTSAYGEGFSNVLGEAMACGLPVIASDVGDSPWLVDDLRWVFHAGDDTELAQKMRALVDLSPQDRAALGQRNRQRIEQNFTVEKMVETTGALCLEQAQARWTGRAAPSLNEPGTASPAPGKDIGVAKAERVLWITTGLGTGGAEMMLTQLIEGLSSGAGHRRHDVISLTPGGKYVEPLRAVGAEVHSLGMPAGRPGLGAVWRLFRLAWKIRPQVIMGWMYHGCLAAVLVKVFRLGRGRVIWNIRQSLYDLSLEKRGSALVIRSLAWVAFFARTITYNSRLSARQHEAIGYPAGKTRLVPNGFDLKKWSRPADAAKDASLRIGRFGRYTAMKDYPGFLAAAAQVAHKLPLAEFVLAGTGVDESNAELNLLLEKLALQERVRLLGERHDLPALTASLDLAVSSSAFGEGFPNVVGEAMACAVPVVATDIGDTAWVMGETGRLVPAKDPEALAAACLQILALSPEERRRLGDEGRRRIAEHFSLERALTEFESLLQSH